MSELPTGWAETTLGGVCQPSQYGWTTSATRENTGLKFLRTTDITKGSVDWDTVPYCVEEPPDVDRYRLTAGDIVISRAGSVGFSAHLDRVEPAAFASYLIRFRPHESLDGKYLGWFLKSPKYWKQIGEATSGITLANVNAKKLSVVRLPLAPLPEQQRIVAAIEEQFSRLDAGVAALERVRQNLKRMRAAVLQAAVDGRLTEHWRSAQLDAESASDLLQWMRSERRHKWEESESAKYATAGKTPPRNWQSKYKEPAPLNRGTEQLPSGWVWCSLNQITKRIGDVDHKMPKAISSGVPYISTRDFREWDEIDFLDAKRISSQDFKALCRKICPEQNDLLLSRYGTVGEVRRVSTEVSFQASYSIAIIKTLPSTPSVIIKYLDIALRSDLLQSQMRSHIRASAQPDLGLEHIRQLMIPLPSETEQALIVNEVERLLSAGKRVEDQLRTELQRAIGLRSSILAAAFSGKLVPQNPTDEPASVLLERIAAQRATSSAPEPTRKPHQLRLPA